MMGAVSAPIKPRFGLGLALALAAAFAFGTSGTLASGLLAAGWTPLAIVVGRVGICALATAIPAYLSLRGRWHLLRRGWQLIIGYGVFAVALTQLAHFSAVQYMAVAPALLVQYLAPLLIVLLLWARLGERPSGQTAGGALVAMIGLVLVLQIIGGGFTGAAAGIIWSIVAMFGNATYFLISADDATGLPPAVLAAGGCLVAVVVLLGVAATGFLPFETSTADAVYAGISFAWWVPLVVVGLFSSAFAYMCGITSSRMLGSRLASFIGLIEVIFAIVISAVLVGQIMTGLQLIGGLMVLAGVVLVKLGEGKTIAPTHEPGTHELADQQLGDPLPTTD